MVRMDSFSSLPPHIQPPMAQVPSAIREELRLVPLILMCSNMLSFPALFFRDRCVSSRATAGWRRCRRTGGSFYKARTAPLPQPLLFLPKAQQLGKNSSVENCGPPGELAEESEASRTP